MNIETLRRFCLALPQASEHVQWGDHIVFKVAGRIFAIGALDTASPHVLSFKCDPERAAELTEREGIVPAPYLARNHWVALETFSALQDREIEACLADSYRLVVGRLPLKVQRTLSAGPARRRPRRRP